MIRVSASAFDILWSDVLRTNPAAGPVPGVLAVPSGGRDEAERSRIRADVYANLADRGLHARGELDDALRERIETLASATLLIEGEFLFDLADPEPLRAVVAVRGRGRGVLAVQPERTIGLASVGAGSACGEAAGILPDVEAGPGSGISLPSAALAEADDPVYATQSRDAGTHAHERQLREVLAVQARPVLAAGQFSVSVRESSPRTRRLGGLTWFLTDVGAYAGSTRPGGDGSSWTTVAPADRSRVAARLADLVESADPAATSAGAATAHR